MSDQKQDVMIYPLGSGKGGVGKTLLAANLGILLSRLNKKVILLDADLGASNLHTALGIPYLRTTLNDLLTGAARNIRDILHATSTPNLQLIGGSRQLPAYQDYQMQLTQKILNELNGLKADILLIDLAGGIAPHVLDFFNLTDQGIVVMTNDPASIQNTYHFLKMAVYRRILKAYPNNPLISYMVNSAAYPRSREKINSVPELVDKIQHVDHYYAEGIQRILQEFTPRIILNMVNHENDVRAFNVFTAVSQKFVGVTPQLLGILEYDDGIKESTLNFRPFTLNSENQKAAEQLDLIANRIAEGTVLQKPAQPAREVSVAAAEPDQEKIHEPKEVWLMNNIQYQDQPLYVLTEKLHHGGAIQTSVYFRGKILFTRTLQYPELNNNNTDTKTLDRLVRKQHLTALKGIELGRIVLDNE
jgi:flagellar biosynthesis protein FlhG